MDDIKIVFDFFYMVISFFWVIDVNVFYELRDNFEEVGVFDWFEVEYFVFLYFDDVDV